MALFLGWVCFRLRGPYYGLVTIAVAEVIRILAVYFRGLTQGSEGLYLPFQPSPINLIFGSRIAYVYLGLVLFGLVAVVTAIIERHPVGYYLAAFRENEDAALALGVPTLKVCLLMVALSAGLTALAGTFYAQYFLYIDPDSVFSMNVSIQIALIAIVGGIRTTWGPLLGALLVIPASFALRVWLGGTFGGLQLMLYGLFVVVVVLSLPTGLEPAFRSLFTRIFRRKVGN